MVRTAAERAVDAFIEDDTVVGLGHGTMVRSKEGFIGMKTTNTSKDVSAEGEEDC